MEPIEDFGNMRKWSFLNTWLLWFVILLAITLVLGVGVAFVFTPFKINLFIGILSGGFAIAMAPLIIQAISRVIRMIKLRIGYRDYFKNKGNKRTWLIIGAVVLILGMLVTLVVLLLVTSGLLIDIPKYEIDEVQAIVESTIIAQGYQGYPVEDVIIFDHSNDEYLGDGRWQGECRITYLVETERKTRSPLDIQGKPYYFTKTVLETVTKMTDYTFFEKSGIVLVE